MPYGLRMRYLFKYSCTQCYCEIYDFYKLVASIRGSVASDHNNHMIWTLIKSEMYVKQHMKAE